MTAQNKQGVTPELKFVSVGESQALVIDKYIEINIDCSENFGEAKNIAQLIAAAPELLEACKEALAYIVSVTNSDNPKETLLKAINKAEGKK